MSDGIGGLNQRSLNPKTGFFSAFGQTKFDANCSLIEYYRNKYWIKYRQDSTGTIRDIEERQEDTVGPFGSAHVVEKSVIYRATSAQPNVYPLRADPVDVTITNPYYLNFIQPFIFQSDGITFSERRFVKPGYVGSGERSKSYKVDGNRVVRMTTLEGDVDITWTKDGPTGRSGNGYQKISLEYTDAGQITSAHYFSRLFPEYAFGFGPLVIKRNGQGDILRFDYLNAPNVLNKALFDYYD